MIALSIITLILMFLAAFILSIISFFRLSDFEEKISKLQKELVATKSTLEDILKNQIVGHSTTPTKPEQPLKEDPSTKPEATEQKQEATDNEQVQKNQEEENQEEQQQSPTPTAQPEAIPEAVHEPIAARSKNLEEAIGAKWSVWIGGIALALGGIFLVRYSIVEGYLTPPVRIILGVLFGGLLMATGEYLRRKENQLNLPQIPIASIPAILTGAGIIASFATLFAAYSLYDMLDPLITFIALGALSILALAAAILHGPMLAGLGLIGSFATPALVSSNAPAAWPLFIYLLFVTAATYGTAHIRNWRPLALAATIAATIWGFIWYGTNWTTADTPAMITYITGLLALTFIGLKQPELSDEQLTAHLATDTKDDPLPFWHLADLSTTGAMALISLLTFVLLRMESYSTISTIILGAIVIAFLYIAYHWNAMKLLSPWSALLFLGAYTTWHLPYLDPTIYQDPYTPEPQLAAFAPPELASFLTIGAIFAGLFAAAGLLYLFKLNRPKGSAPISWAIVSAITPVLILAYSYYRATDFEQSLPFAGFAFALAALAALTADHFIKTRLTDLSPNDDWPNDGWKKDIWDTVTGTYAIASVSALSLGLTMALSKGWLTISLSLITLGLAWISTKRRMPALSPLAIAITALVMARLLYDPRILGGDLGTTPIFNWLLYGYGVPAIAFAGAAWFFQKSADRFTMQVMQAASILFTAVLISLEIRHWVTGGNMYSGHLNLFELSLHTISWFGLSIGLQRIFRGHSNNTIVSAINILRIGGLVSILFGHLIWFNPLFTNISIGNGAIFNDLLLAYAIPAFMAAIVYVLGSKNGTNKSLYTIIAGITSFVLFFTYITLMVRAQFHGSHLASGFTSDPESYSYSITWLIFALGLLGAGTWLKTAQLRYAGLLMLVLVIIKVFILDMSNLTGLLRALSFIGLGLAMMAIGYLYQKVIAPPKPEEPAMDQNDEQELQ